MEDEGAAQGLPVTLSARKARIGDVPTMHRLINEHAEAGTMLARPLSELYENLRDFWVIEEDEGTVVACAALHVNWADLAEVRSVVVDKRRQRRGLGRTLVRACIEEAREMGLSRVYALTREAGFFESLGFTRIGVNELPRKVWGECIRCPKFPECDEVAVVFDLFDSSIYRSTDGAESRGSEDGTQGSALFQGTRMGQG